MDDGKQLREHTAKDSSSYRIIYHDELDLIDPYIEKDLVASVKESWVDEEEDLFDKLLARGLTDLEAAIILYHECMGNSWRAIGEIIDIPYSTVYRYGTRALAKLKKKLEETGDTTI